MKTLFKNGLIIDGSGEKPFAGDLLIGDDRILAVGGEITETADRVVELGGAQICPGVHAKMIHGTSIMREEPLLAVNGDGVRFMEEDIEYTRRNTIL